MGRLPSAAVVLVTATELVTARTPEGVVVVVVVVVVVPRASLGPAVRAPHAKRGQSSSKTALGALGRRTLRA